MATVNFIKSKNQNAVYLRRLIDYVKQTHKTISDGEWLVTGIGCKSANAFRDYMRVRNDYHKNGGRFFYHLDQSFHPDENVTPKQAHEIAVKLSEYYKDFQVLVATHVDKGHLHSHLVVNAVS